MHKTDRLEVAYAMQRHGGAFVRALSQALVVADEVNANVIIVAFPDYWEKYSEMAAKMKDDSPRDGS